MSNDAGCLRGQGARNLGNISLKRLPLEEIDRIQSEMVSLLQEDALLPVRPSEVLRATAKSQVVAVIDSRGRELVVKRHTHRAGYLREVWAHNIVAGERCAPPILFKHDAKFLIVFPRYSQFDIQSMSETDLLGLFAMLGRFHGRAVRVGKAVNIDRVQRLSMEGLEEQRFWNSTPALCSFARDLCRRAPVGSDHVALGDVNAGHLLIHKGSTVFCDLETFAFAQPSEVDILALLDACKLSARTLTHDSDPLTAYYSARDAASPVSRSFEELICSVRRLDECLSAAVGELR